MQEVAQNPGEEIAALTPADIRDAWLAGAISQRAFDLITTSRKLNEKEKRSKLTALARAAQWKRRSTRKYAHLSGDEKHLKHLDKVASIDDALNAARAAINWERRKAAERSLLDWLRTYCMDAPPSAQLFKYAPSERLCEAVKLMDAGVGDNSFPYHIRIARGFGKTTFAEAAVAYAIATGKRRFAVLISAKTDDAVQLMEDIFSIFAGGDTFAQDYPDIAVPIRKLDGSWRRRISFKGRRVHITKSHNKVVLPDVLQEDGTPSPASGAVITARGKEGRVRGLKAGSMRPDLLILDDLQTDSDAANEETVAKTVAKVRSNFLNLGGREKLSIVMTSTPIAPNDLSETFAADSAWKTTTFKAFECWPTEWTAHGREGLWGEYRRIYERQLYTGDGARDPRKAALNFYQANREAMDKGAKVLDENRYDHKVQASAIQALMDTFFDNGEESFEAEQQMMPRRRQYAFELTPQVVLQRIRKGTAPGTLIPNAVFTCAATDINPSYALTTTIISFDVDRTGLVAAYHVTPMNISDRANDTEYHARIFEALCAHAREVADICKRSNVKLDAFGIDGGGKQFDPVTRFAAESEKLVGLKVTAMTGRAGQAWNPFVKSRIKQPLNETVFCRDTQGRTWLAFNADAHKESAQKSFGSEVGAKGGLSLFDGNVDHTDFAIQVSNERLMEKKAKPDGRFAYRWRSRNPHDFLDCLSMSFALAGANGISGAGRVEVSHRKIAVCL